MDVCPNTISEQINPGEDSLETDPRRYLKRTYRAPSMCEADANQKTDNVKPMTRSRPFSSNTGITLNMQKMKLVRTRTGSLPSL